MRKILATVLILTAAFSASAAITLDPANPTANFNKEGTQPHTPGAALRLQDTSAGDFVYFFVNDLDAAPGLELDVTATFQISSFAPNNADVGNRIVINDGVGHAVVAACARLNNVRGIGLLGQGLASEPASYPVFIPVDWQTAPVTIRLRRTAAGDGEIVEINGVAPTPRAILLAAQLPGGTRPNPSVEFGAHSPEAEATVDYFALRSEKIAPAALGTLTFTKLRLRDTDSVDRLRFRADYTLGSTSDGIDPATQPVTVKLSTPAGQFYPLPDFNPLNGFTVQVQTNRRRWALNDAERARTGIERIEIDEDPNKTGAFFLRDFRTTVLYTDYSTVNVEVTIGTGASQDKLTGTATLVQKPPGSGRWRLTMER